MAQKETDTAMIIDCHTHAWPSEDFGALAELWSYVDGGLSECSPYNWTPRFEGTVDSLVHEEKLAGVDRLVLLPVSARPDRCRALCDWAIRAASEHPEIIPFGAVHPCTKTPAEDIARIRELGMPAVKIHSLIQRFDCMAPSSLDLFAVLEDAGLPVLMDSMFLSGTAEVKPNLAPLMSHAVSEGWETTPDRIFEIARRFPKLCIIAAHMGCLYGWHLVDPLYELDQVWFDMAYIHRLMTKDQVVEIIQKKGADRIIWGTDAPYRRPLRALSWFNELPLSPEDKNRILGQNLMDLIGPAD